MFGLLNIDKPADWTSRDVVNYVQKIVRGEGRLSRDGRNRGGTRKVKVGHAGTLDPLATGVLVVCLGPATRLVEFVQRMPKTYRATFLLGRTSDTDDIEGHVRVLEGRPTPLRDDIERAIPQFIGEIDQVPPAYSAVKLSGRRAYDLARSGVDVQLEPRKVHVSSIVVDRFDDPELELTIRCGSGTYIRALGRDLAAALGSGAVMASLVRTAIGPRITVENAVPVERLDQETLAQHLLPPTEAVRGIEAIKLNRDQHEAIRVGRPIVPNEQWPHDSHAVDEFVGLDAAGNLLAVLTRHPDGKFYPVRNFSAIGSS
jgi:tRNA pseudouridine55 synthase